MAKYIKKPIVVEAVQWDPNSFEMPKPYEPDKLGVIWCYNAMGQVFSGIIETLEGDMEVQMGDWIITGIKDEKYPVKDEIFRQSYELVED